MESKWMLIADLHLWKNRLGKQRSMLQWFKDKAVEDKPSHIIFLGDSFHSRSHVCVETQQTFRDLILFFQQCDWLPGIHILVGNHDMVNRYERSLNCPSLFENIERRTFVYSELRIVNLDGIQCLFAPWHEDQKPLAQYLSTIENPHNVVVMAHVAVDGTRVNGISDNSNRICEDTGLGLALLKRFKRVFAGHFHHHAVYGNFMYVGAPMMYSFSDVEQVKRGFVMYYPSNDSWELNVNPFAVQYLSLSLQDATDANPDVFKDKHVRINVGQSRDLVDTLELERTIEKHGAIFVETKYPQITIVQPIIADVRVRSNIRDMIFEFVNSQKFSDEDKQRRLEKAYDWCDTIGAVTERNKFHCKISTVEIHNFLGTTGTTIFHYGHLRPGLWYLQGHNGAGKTTLREAILYGLFGENARGIKVTEIINNLNKDSLLYVKITLEDGLIIMRQRHKTKSSLLITLANGEVLQRGSVSDTQKELENLMNVDISTFERITTLTGSKIKQYFSDHDNDKHEIIEKLFGLNLKELHEHIKSDLKNANDDLNKELINMKDVQNKNMLVESKIQQLSNQIDTENGKMKTYTDIISSATKTYDQKQKALSLLDLKKRDLFLVEQDLDEKITRFSSEQYEIECQLNKIKEERKHMIDSNHTWTQMKESRDNKLKDCENKLDSLETDIKTLKAEGIQLEKQKLHIDKESDNTDFEIKESKAKHSKICNVLSIIANNVAKLQEDRIRILDRISSTNYAVETQQKEIENWISESSSLKKKVIKISEELDYIETQINETQNGYNLNQDIVSKKLELDDLLQRILAHQTRIELDLHANEEQSRDDQRDLDNVISQIDLLCHEKDNCMETINSILGDIREYDKLRQTISETQRNLNSLKENRYSKSRNQELVDIRNSTHIVSKKIENESIRIELQNNVANPLSIFIECNEIVNDEITSMDDIIQRTEEQLKESIFSMNQLESDADLKFRLDLQKQNATRLSDKISTLQKNRYRLEENIRNDYLNRQNSASFNSSCLTKMFEQRSLLDKELFDMETKINLLNRLGEMKLQKSLELSESSDRLNSIMINLESQKKVDENNEISDLNTKIDEILSTIKSKEKKRSDAEKKLALVDSKLSDLQQQTREFYNEYERLQMLINDISISISKYETERSHVESMFQDIKENIMSNDPPFSNSDILVKGEEYDKIMENFNQLKLKREEATDLKNKTINEIDCVKSESFSLYQEKLDTQKMIDKHKTLQDDSTRRCADFSRDFNALSLEVHDISLRLQEISQNVDAKRREKMDLEFWADATSTSSRSKKGVFRQFCLKQSAEIINSQLHETLKTLNDGHLSNLDCKVTDDLVLQHCGKSVSFKHRSEGEQHITQLAVIFTIMDIVIQNSSFEINVLFLDEIMNHLDQHAIYTVEKWISDFTRKKPDLRTFLITHTEIASAGKSSGIIRASKNRHVGSKYNCIDHEHGQINFASRA